MVSGHTHDHKGNHPSMGLGRYLVDKIMHDQSIVRRVYSDLKLDREHDLPYLGGYSKDGKTIYLDRHLPEFLTLHEDGKAREFDPTPFLLVHEKWEKAIIDELHWTYPPSHEVATGIERRQVLAHGLPWAAYSNALKPFIKADEHEKLVKVPKDLDLTPYYGPPPDTVLLHHLEKKMGGASDAKFDKNEVDYGEGKPTSHCGPMERWPNGACEYFKKPNACEKVRGFIKPDGWCGLWYSK